jgi:hypothetical protein
MANQPKPMVNSISLEEIYGTIERIFSIIESLGIIINKQSRFYKFKDSLYKELTENKRIEVTVSGDSYSIPIDIPRILKRTSLLGQGMRDFFELWAIVSSETILNNNQNELTQIFGGNVDLFEDKITNTKSRDLQYQLFMTALFNLSGYEVMISEPDFKFVLEGKQLSVACKRISSSNKMNRRIREAEKQIELSGTNGLIALSLDRLVGLNFHSSNTNIDRLMQDAREMVHGILQGNYPKRLPLLGSNILGILASLCMIGTDFITEKLSFAYACEFLIYDHGDNTMNDKLFELAYSTRIDMSKLV